MFIELHSRNLQHRKNTIICSFQKNEPSICLQNLSKFTPFCEILKRSIFEMKQFMHAAKCEVMAQRVRSVRPPSRPYFRSPSSEAYSPNDERSQDTNFGEIPNNPKFANLWRNSLRNGARFQQIYSIEKLHPIPYVRGICDRTLDGLVLGRSLGT